MVAKSSPADRGEANLASNLRRLRSGAGLTLDQLADCSGVSRAMISKIERGVSVPTATVLGKLAAGLQASLSQLLGDPSPRHPRLNPKSEQVVYHDPATGFERRSLSPLFDDGAVDFAFNTLPAGQSASFPPHHAGVEEYLAVHDGELVVVLDGKRFTVEAGGSLFYPSDCEHEFRNETGRPATFYIVVDDRARR